MCGHMYIYICIYLFVCLFYCVFVYVFVYLFTWLLIYKGMTLVVERFLQGSCGFWVVRLMFYSCDNRTKWNVKDSISALGHKGLRLRGLEVAQARKPNLHWSRVTFFWGFEVMCIYNFSVSVYLSPEKALIRSSTILTPYPQTLTVGGRNSGCGGCPSFLAQGDEVYGFHLVLDIACLERKLNAEVLFIDGLQCHLGFRLEWAKAPR